MTDGQAYEVTKILKMNVTGGTGTAANYGCPAAGKTGTTDEAKDAWFVGYTPKLSTSVWVGYPDAARRDAGRAGRHLRGAGLARLHAPGHRRATARTSRCRRSRSSPRPFFGKYSSTGGAGTGGYYYDEDADRSTDDDTGDTEYDPRYYETPPQDAPEVQQPPDEVAPTPTPEIPQGGEGGGHPG